MGAAELSQALGYDPDDPATWPGNKAEPEADLVPLSDPRVMRALAHPLRTALLELLSVVDTITATQASEVLGESPATCAFHLRTLGKYGFAEEAGGGRGRERPWTASKKRIRVSATGQTDRQAALAAETLSRFWLEQWLDKARLVFGGSTALPGWDGVTQWTRDGIYLTAEEAGQVMREMRQILDRYADRQHDPALRPPGALPVEWSIFSAPLAELAHLGTEDPKPDQLPGHEARRAAPPASRSATLRAAPQPDPGR